VPTAEFFTRFGLFVVRDFLDAAACARLCSEIGRANKIPGAVGGEGAEYKIDRRARSTDIAEVSSDAEAVLAGRLVALLPELAEHFSMQFQGHQGLQFLAYKNGDFFEPHCDRNDTPEGAAFSRNRRVSVVTFLNDESEEPGKNVYGGGLLTFYGLLDGPNGANIGLPLVGETGVLVAFESGLRHGVTPVTHGERYTVVTWLF
jgi:SM-20-related protein